MFYDLTRENKFEEDKKKMNAELIKILEEYGYVFKGR